MRIAILGCGPSGLVAAHALARECGIVPDIWSRKIKSPIFGAQYLHNPIPGIPLPEPTVIRYMLQGEPEQYLRKVYGNQWDGTINDEMHAQAHLAWDLRTAYDRLWESWEDKIGHVDLNPRNIADLATVIDQYDMVINTLPRKVLCVMPGHQFKGVPIYAMGDSPDQQAPRHAKEGEIIYNGLEAPGWYRASTIQGFSTVEWPGGTARPPIDGVVAVQKPLGHNCDCWGKSMHHLGRMGKWQNGKLVHHVYADAVELIRLKRMGEIK